MAKEENGVGRDGKVVLQKEEVSGEEKKGF